MEKKKPRGFGWIIENGEFQIHSLSLRQVHVQTTVNYRKSSDGSRRRRWRPTSLKMRYATESTRVGA
jgi:hypothetical protein